MVHLILARWCFRTVVGILSTFLRFWLIFTSLTQNGLPKMDGSYQKDVPLTTIDENTIPHTDLTVYTDPRLDVSTGRFNTPFLDWSIPTTIDGWIREITNGGPYLNKKRTSQRKLIKEAYPFRQRLLLLPRTSI